jgi:predicted dehydrogenase
MEIIGNTIRGEIMNSKPVKAGIIGCGNISGIYFENGAKLQILEIAACSDMILERAKTAAERYGIAKACSVEQLLADPEIEIVLNLTIPKAHYEVAMSALKAGKSVYNEKPLALTREQGKHLLSVAKQSGLRVGCAPDTFMGGAHQTCRKAIDDGLIGEVVAATAFMMCHGHEIWHPDPEFYYKVGGGPMFDMGPYYLTALINMIGPIRRVTGSARASFAERLITSQPKSGTVITVDTPTHIAGVMDFANGAIGTIITSFDTWAANVPRIEIHGTKGSLSVPDPNGFGGGGRIFTPGNDWKDLPIHHGFNGNSRAIGLADMAQAIRSGRLHRASGELAYHVLDAMHAFLDASNQGRHIELTSTCQRPAALPLGLSETELDA